MTTWGECGHPLHRGTCRVCHINGDERDDGCLGEHRLAHFYGKRWSPAGCAGPIDYAMQRQDWRGREAEANACDGEDPLWRTIPSSYEEALDYGRYFPFYNTPPVLRPAYDVDGRPLARPLRGAVIKIVNDERTVYQPWRELP